jgi:hypothetical protein
MFARVSVAAMVVIGWLVSAAAADEPLFPFVISYHPQAGSRQAGTAPANVTNLSAWLDRPAGRRGFVRAENGHLVTRAGPIRFWGTNLCFEACFPSHQQAERLAARLARLGINCVRLHHMDSRSIWGDSPNKLTIDPQKLERLDYLIDQLKRHGVYVDINLHVSRWFGEPDGFVAREARPNYDKGLDNFEPRMIQLQKKYARDLLTHVNPYTQTAYTREPAVALIEISNEDALFAIWNGGQLDRLPEPYATTFRKLWNAWLRKKYGSTERLGQAWAAGLGANQRLEDDSVPVLRRRGPNRTPAARSDFADFLWDTERDYWWGMYRFLKDELGVRSLVSGTQLSYSPVHVQAGLDYIDAHAYWKHPSFPGRPWDPRNWTVHNVALVNSPGGTLASLAGRRVAGMPLSVSEYNHPAPNVYAAEGFPLIAAFGAFQGWDGIFSFAYSHNTDFEPRRITSFFDIKSDTPKLAHMPACAALFVRGDVAGARTTLLVPLSRQAEKAKLHKTLSAWTLTAENLGLDDPRASLLHAVALDIGKGTFPAGRGQGWTSHPRHPVPQLKQKDAQVFVSDTGQLRWDVSQQGAACFIADTPRTKLFTGFVRGRTFRLGKVTLAIGKTRLDWATVSMVCMDGGGFDQPGRILITATGWVQNQDAQLEHLENDRVTLQDRWGSEPVLCEGVPAQITLPVPAERVRWFPLDESGSRRAAAACDEQDGHALLKLGPTYHTVWYEVELR